MKGRLEGSNCKVEEEWKRARHGFRKRVECYVSVELLASSQVFSHLTFIFFSNWFSTCWCCAVDAPALCGFLHLETREKMVCAKCSAFVKGDYLFIYFFLVQ